MNFNEIQYDEQSFSGSKQNFCCKLLIKFGSAIKYSYLFHLKI